VKPVRLPVPEEDLFGTGIAWAIHARVKYALLTLRVFHRACRRLAPHTVKPVMQGFLPDRQVSALLARGVFSRTAWAESLREAERLSVSEEFF
jgi:hypothetical protein